MHIRHLKVGVGALLAFIFLPSPSEAQQCGQAYEVRSGDTLSFIARRVFHDTSRWLDLYEFQSNAATIGSNPDLLQVGMTIQMPPCDGESGYDFAASTSAAKIPPTITPSPAGSGSDESKYAKSFVPTIEVITGGDYAPFTDQEVPGGGMLTQVVVEALNESGLGNEFRIDFINDWGSHLNVLLPKGKYHFGFPWFQPNCNDPNKLPEDMQIRCEYIFSDPLYTVSIAFYASADIENPPTDFAALAGKRICRPSGYFTFDLAEHGLFDKENIDLVRPATVDGCFRALEKGEVDYVSINRFTGSKALARADLVDVVRPLKTLITVLDLHLVAHQDDTIASHRWMDSFNQGLRAVQENGTYGQIVSYHLQKHREEVERIGQQ